MYSYIRDHNKRFQVNRILKKIFH